MTAAGIKPDAQATGWDAAPIVISALRKAGLNASSDQLRATLANTQGLAGVTGSYDFKAVPQRGVGIDAIVVQRWDVSKGTWIAVSKPGGAIK